MTLSCKYGNRLDIGNFIPRFKAGSEINKNTCMVIKVGGGLLDPVSLLSFAV